MIESRLIIYSDWITYENYGGDSGIARYMTCIWHWWPSGRDEWQWIEIIFKRGRYRKYQYSLDSLRKASRLETMIALADAGQGLNSYINHNVKYNYETRQ